MSKFFPTNGFKWIDPKEFDLNKYTSNSSKGWALELDLEYPKKLQKLRDGYLLVPNKIKIKREMSTNYQLNFVDLYNIPYSNVKNLVPNVFDKEKYVIYYENLNIYFSLGLKLKKLHCVLEFN